MVVLLNKNVVELQKRRDERLDAAKLKIEDVLEFTKLYKLNRVEEEVKILINELKKSIKVSGASDAEKGYVYFKYLDIPQDQAVSYVKGFVDLLFGAYEEVVCKELFDFEKGLQAYFEVANASRLPELKKNVRELTGLVSITKNAKMDKDLFEIEKDLLACIGYNEKIAKEQEYEKTGE